MELISYWLINFTLS